MAAPTSTTDVPPYTKRFGGGNLLNLFQKKMIFSNSILLVDYNSYMHPEDQKAAAPTTTTTVCPYALRALGGSTFVPPLN